MHCSGSRCRNDYFVRYRAGATVLNPNHELKFCETCYPIFGEQLAAALMAARRAARPRFIIMRERLKEIES